MGSQTFNPRASGLGWRAARRRALGRRPAAHPSHRGDHDDAGEGAGQRRRAGLRRRPGRRAAGHRWRRRVAPRLGGGARLGDGAVAAGPLAAGPALAAAAIATAVAPTPAPAGAGRRRGRRARDGRRDARGAPRRSGGAPRRVGRISGTIRSSSGHSTVIFWPMNFSIASRLSALASSTRPMALPPAPARAVRPMRCT